MALYTQITTIADDIAEANRAAPPSVASALAAQAAEAAVELAESLSTTENGIHSLLRQADVAAATLARRRGLQVWWSRSARSRGLRQHVGQDRGEGRPV